MKIQPFYNYKTIQKSYKFEVTFENSHKRKDLSMNKDIMPYLDKFHVIDVSIPFYEFKKEVQYYGPFPRPMTVLASDGLELEITFEEDEFGTISKFVNWCQRRIINEQGYYTPPGLNYIDNIFVEILDERDDIISRFNFKKCKFLHASPMKFSYETEESIKIQMIFSCEMQELLFRRGDNVE